MLQLKHRWPRSRPKHRASRQSGRTALSLSLVVSLLAAVLSVLVVGTTTAPAQAEKAGPGTAEIPGFSGYVLANNGELGVGRLPNGRYGICTDTGAEFDWPGNPTMTLVNNPRTAYAAGKYIPMAIGNARIAAALWWAVGYDLGANSQPGAVMGHVNSLASENPAFYADVKAWHDRIVADANANAAPTGGYQAGGIQIVNLQPHNGRVENVGVKNGAGNWIDSGDITLTITGDAHFDATGTKTWTGPALNAPRDVYFTQDGPGAISVQMSVTGLPPKTYQQFYGGPGTQRVIAFDELESVSSSDSAVDDTGTVRARKVDADTDDPLEGAVFRVWGEVAGGMDKVKSANEPSRDMTTNVNGRTGYFDWFADGQPAQVCFREIKAPPGYLINKNVFCVEATKAGAEVVIGDKSGIPDTWEYLPLRVAKFAEGGDATGLIGVSFEVREDNPTTGRVVDSHTFSAADIQPDGSAQVVFTASPDNCNPDATPTLICRYDPIVHDYFVVITGEPAGWLPAATVVQAQINATNPTELSARLDDRKVWEPTVVTQVSDQNAAPGEVLTDNVMVSGTGGKSLVGQWGIFGPIAPSADFTCAGLDWTNAPLNNNGFFDINGDGTYTVGSTQITLTGCYTYITSIAGSADGTSLAMPNTAFGIPEETSLVAYDPSLTTQINSQKVTVGEKLIDTVKVVNTGGSTVTGGWRLLGPIAPAVDSDAEIRTAGRCQGLDWTDAPIAAEGTFTAVGDGDVLAGEHTVTAGGCYTYVENLNPSGSTRGFAWTAPGEVTETAIATWNPRGSTQASTQMATVGATITDAVTITGTGGVATTGTWNLLGPVKPIVGPSGRTCEGIDWTNVASAASGEFAITEDKTYTVGEYTVARMGCYTYTEHIVGGDVTEPGGGMDTPGTPSETFLITTGPILTTAVSEQVVTVGGTIIDAVTVTNTNGATITGTWNLLGPIAPNTELVGNTISHNRCLGLDWTGAPVAATGEFTVAGDGTYQVGSFTVVESGCYTYTEALPETADSDAVSTLPGIAVETTLVLDAPQLATKISDKTTKVGDTITDDVIVTGAGDQVVRGKWRLWGPIDPKDGTCQGLTWKNAPLAAEGEFEVEGDGTYQVGTYTIKKAGCYTYSEALAPTATSQEVDWLELGTEAETTLAIEETVDEDHTSEDNTTTEDNWTEDTTTVTQINAGNGATASDHTWLLAGGLALILTAGIGGSAFVFRRTRKGRLTTTPPGN